MAKSQKLFPLLTMPPYLAYDQYVTGYLLGATMNSDENIGEKSPKYVQVHRFDWLPESHQSIMSPMLKTNQDHTLFYPPRFTSYMPERSDFLCLCKVLATLPKKARIIVNLEVDLLIFRNFDHAHRQKRSDLSAMNEVVIVSINQVAV